MDTEVLKLQEQVKYLYNAIPSSLIGNIFASYIAVYVFRGSVSPYNLFIWVGFLLLISLGRYLNYLSYKKHQPDTDDIRRWYLQFVLGSILVASAVGSAGWLLFVDDNNFQVTLALMIVCIAAFAITTMAPRQNIVIIFLIIIFAPVMESLFLSGTEIGRYIFWMMLALLILLIMSSIRISKTILQSITLTIEAEKREEILRNSQRRLSLYFQETPLAVIEWNKHHEVVDWNPAAKKIFGYTEAEAIGKKASELIVPENSIEEVSKGWKHILSNGESFQSINENLRKNGEVILCEWFNTPLINQQGQVIGVISLAQDVTERIKTEKLKNEFVSIVSHELRTPVTSIKGSLALLSSGVLKDDDTKSQEMIDIALRNTNRLHLLLNDILDVEKLESGKVDYRFREYDLIKLIEDVIHANQSYADQYQVAINASNMPESFPVFIDPDRLFQVLTNILSNGIKFSVTGGTVVVSVTLRDKKARVNINNFGEVIPESDREQMFSKFFQRDSSDSRSKEGSGLGLYICQRILEKHNSVLDFESSSEKGTTFFFELVEAGGTNL